MENEKRGIIRNRKFATQIRDMSGLAYGSITPTDIDAFMDFGGKLFVFIEAKHGKSECRKGQLLALERLCDACQAAGIESLLILASHDEALEVDIDYGKLNVVRFRYSGKWSTPTEPIATRKCITFFRNSIFKKRRTSSDG